MCFTTNSTTAVVCLLQYDNQQEFLIRHVFGDDSPIEYGCAIGNAI